MIDGEDLMIVSSDDGVIKLILIYKIGIAGSDYGYKLSANGVFGQSAVIRRLLELRRIVVHVHNRHPNVCRAG